MYKTGDTQTPQILQVPNNETESVKLAVLCTFRPLERIIWNKQFLTTDTVVYNSPVIARVKLFLEDGGREVF